MQCCALFYLFFIFYFFKLKARERELVCCEDNKIPIPVSPAFLLLSILLYLSLRCVYCWSFTVSRET